MTSSVLGKKQIPDNKVFWIILNSVPGLTKVNKISIYLCFAEHQDWLFSNVYTKPFLIMLRAGLEMLFVFHFQARKPVGYKGTISPATNIKSIHIKPPRKQKDGIFFPLFLKAFVKFYEVTTVNLKTNYSIHSILLSASQ